ncbi:hypothetical protein D3C72_2597010 [compost metagenome]
MDGQGDPRSDEIKLQPERFCSASLDYQGQALFLLEATYQVVRAQPCEVSDGAEDVLTFVEGWAHTA